MKVVNLESQDSIISNYMAELRDCHVQQGRLLFRENLRRIARLMAYEISKTLDYAPQLVHTPLADRNVRTMNERLVVGTVLRAGLAFHEGFLDVFDKADAGFVAAYREEGTKENIRIQLDYLAAPHLEGSTFLLVDPMLATGGSLALAYDTFCRNGQPRKLHICCVIAAPEGIRRLEAAFPSDDVTLWVAAIDDHLNEQAYIVPGLGDAGDLSFGEKLSH